MPVKPAFVRIPLPAHAASARASLEFNGKDFHVIGGPCSVESEAQFQITADAVKRSGANLLRGGIYKLRTDTESFQGLGEQSWDFVRKVCRETGMPLVTEVTDPRQIEAMTEFVDVFQVGTRNMYNYALLKELGLAGKPVLLKRAFSATLDEWILAARYVTREGNPNVILCERGIRTFEPAFRNTLDLSAIPYVKARSEFPIIVDPSHATGIREFVAPMALAAIAAGADGLLIEVHPDPALALSDGPQALDFPAFEALMRQIDGLCTHLGRRLVRLDPIKTASSERPSEAAAE